MECCYFFVAFHHLLCRSLCTKIPILSHFQETLTVIYAVTVTKKGAKKGTNLKATITVKNEAIKVSGASVIAVGEKATLKTATAPKGAAVSFKSSDETIATVDEKGVVTAVKAGKVTITATAGKASKDIEIEVKNVILKDVKQASTTKLTATIAGNTANVKTSDIVITNTFSKATIAVKSVAVDATDKTQVTVETYVPMADGKDYTVTLSDVTKTFTATDGKIVNATISPASVVVPTPANNSDGSNANDLVAKFTDANGVEISSVKPTSTTVPTGFTYVEWKVDATNNGYLSGNTLNLYKVGNTAKVTVIAHTGKYDASAKEEGTVTAEATITGVDPTAITTAAWNVKLGKSTDNASEFKNIKETKVAVKDTDAVAYIQRATSDGKSADAKDYKFESSDKDVMTVTTTTTSIKDTTAVKVVPYKAGTAYIIVKDSKDNVVTTLSVTIGEERKVAALTLDKNAFVLSAKAGIDNDVTVKVTAKDQYGEEVSIGAGLKCTNANSKAAAADTKITCPSANQIKVEKPSLAAGNKDSSNTYIVEYKDVKVTFTIVVKAYDTTTTTPAAFDLVLSADKADAVIKADATDSTKITATIVGYDKNGVKISEDSDVAWTLKKDGKDAGDANGATSGSALTINVNNKTSGKQMATGVYTLTVNYNGKDFVKTFEITNTQPTLSVSRVKTEANSVGACFEFSYEGQKISNPSVTFYGLNGEKVTNSTGDVYVAKAVVVKNLDATKNNNVELTVNIGYTVTVK